MARRQQAQAGAINIRVHDHPTSDVYLHLLKSAYDLQRPLKARGEQMLLLSSLNKPKMDGTLQYVEGMLARFTNINSDEPWFNLKTKNVAESGEVSEIDIPEHLRPGFKGFRFCFFPKKHYFVFERAADKSTISHGMVESFLERLLNSPELSDDYGEVNVNTVCEEKGLREIYAIPTLKNLEIVIKRPNPDQLSSDEAVVMARLAKMNANKVQQKLTATTGESLKPDADTKILAKVALDNGFVKGEGHDSDRRKIEVSTKAYPKTLRKSFHETEMTPKTAFNLLAREFLQ